MTLEDLENVNSRGTQEEHKRNSERTTKGVQIYDIMYVTEY